MWVAASACLERIFATAGLSGYGTQSPANGHARDTSPRDFGSLDLAQRSL
jgi:hypothetical protein